MIIRIILSTLLGLCGTLFIAQKDPWVKQKVGDAFTHILATTFDCEVSGNVIFFDVVNPRLFVTDLSMKALDNSWHWSTKIYRSGFSWIDFIKNRFIPLWVHMKDLEADSKVRAGVPTIFPHIRDLLKGPDLPVPLALSEAKVRSAVLSISDNDIKTVCHWDCDGRKEGHSFHSHFRLRSGEICYKENTYLSDLNGVMNVTTQKKEKEMDYAMQLDVRCSMVQLGTYPTCFITGNWHHNRGRFQVQSIDRSLRINPLIISEKNDDVYVEATASLPLHFMYKLFFNTTESPVQGTCGLKFKGSLNDVGSSDGLIICEDLQLPWLTQPCICNATFAKREGNWNGIWDIKGERNQALHGSFRWDALAQLGEAFIGNETPFSFAQYAHYTVQPQDAQMQLSYNKATDCVEGNYKICVSNSLHNINIQSMGSCIINAERIVRSDGFVGSHRYQCKAELQPLHFSQLKIWDSKEHQIVDYVYNAIRKQYQSTVDFSIVQELCEAFWQHEIHGEGKIRCSGNKENDLFHLKLALDNATIRLPQTYNFVNGATVNITGDLKRKRLWFNDLCCTLHNGTITSSEGVMWLNDAGGLQFVHMPFLIDRCLVTAKQDLFAVISGNLLLSKKQKEHALVSGNIMINRAQLKENIFSEQVQKKLFSAAGLMRGNKKIPLSCDISIETKEPIRVDTPFLQANAQVGLHVKGFLQDPIIEGSIQVPSGSIRFPYQPLHITKGEIVFVKEQPLNPFVELIAKNNIKNHLITLNVTGSLQDTTVLLESTPPLSEEQVIGLLIAGAHENSLDAVIPALLMQNMTNYIFSSHKSNFFDQYIKPWMKQIHVHLKPNFSDQSGRGGLRGTLEIVVNDRWRAMIEKNFSLTEDTHFELEYILSDDITFRVIRDERRDVGGEVEMRWKF